METTLDVSLMHLTEGFKLPSGASRSPDAAWVEKSRIESIAPILTNFCHWLPIF